MNAVFRAGVGLVAGLLLVSGCAAPITLPAEASRPTRLTFLISGDPTDNAAYQALVDSFLAANPDIGIDLLNIPSSGDFSRRLAADFAANTPPDLFLINYRRYAPFAAGGAIEPIDAYLTRRKQLYVDEFYPQAIDAFTWQGELMCLPQNVSSPVVYYNKNLFDAADIAYPAGGWNWNEFLTTAVALTVDIDGDSRIEQFGLGIEPTIVRAAPFIWMNGGSVVDDPQNPKALALDTPAAREALAWFVGLQTEHHVVPDAVAEAAESSLSRFMRGGIGMFVDSRRATPEFRQIEGFDWDVAPLPSGKQRVSILHSDAYCIAAASVNKDAAWRFVEFANTREGQKLLARTGRTIPSRVDLAGDSTLLDPQVKPANSWVFVDAIPTIRSLPKLETWLDVEEAIDAELEQAFYGQITLDEALQAAAERSEEFFQ